MKYNTQVQNYRGIKIRLIEYTDRHFARLGAKRFLLISDVKTEHPNQNLWIPNVYLEPDGTLKQKIDIDFVFVRAMLQRKFRYAGIKVPCWLYRRANPEQKKGG